MTKIKDPLTTRQHEYLDFIKEFISENGCSPTRDGIACKFKTGANNVSRYIDVLCEKGWLRKDNTRRPPVLKILL